jgi:hypothetical protein
VRRHITWLGAMAGSGSPHDSRSAAREIDTGPTALGLLSDIGTRPRRAGEVGTRAPFCRERLMWRGARDHVLSREPLQPARPAGTEPMPDALRPRGRRASVLLSGPSISGPAARLYSEIQRTGGRPSSIEFKQRMESAYRDGTAPWETGRPCSEIQRRLVAGDLPTSGTALDPGCGSGVQTLPLAAHGLQAVGVDLSTSAIEEAQRRASGHSAEGRVRSSLEM